MSDTVSLIIVLAPALIVAIVFHEVAHGLVANWLGDPTAREQKRLSLNPLRHVDPVGTLLVPGMLALASGPIFGWAKPVPVVKRRLRNPRYGMMVVAAAGPGTNFVLAAIASIVAGVAGLAAQFQTLAGNGLGNEPTLTGVALFLFILINIFLGMFNLLPIPPFDGSHIVEGLLPRRYVHLYERLRPFGMLLFMGLVLLTWFAPELGVLENTIGPPVDWALRQYLSLAQAVSG